MVCQPRQCWSQTIYPPSRGSPALRARGDAYRRTGGTARLDVSDRGEQGMDELLYASATTMAQAIREKRVSATEMVEAHLQRIAAVNPVLNAVVQVVGPRARMEAMAADQALARGELRGPLHGVPITIKDSLDTAGVISTGGTKGRATFVPEQDATVVARLRAAGAILLGKTNTPELTLSGETDNLVYGRTNNPYDVSRTPGGSSGGAGAILASGGSALDIGSDTGGSGCADAAWPYGTIRRRFNIDAPDHRWC